MRLEGSNVGVTTVERWMLAGGLPHFTGIQWWCSRLRLNWTRSVAIGCRPVHTEKKRTRCERLRRPQFDCTIIMAPPHGGSRRMSLGLMMTTISGQGKPGPRRPNRPPGSPRFMSGTITITGAREPGLVGLDDHDGCFTEFKRA